MEETRVWSLGREDPLEKEMATYSSILAWKIPRAEEPGGATVHRVAKSQTRVSNFTTIMWVVYRTNSSSRPWNFVKLLD